MSLDPGILLALAGMLTGSLASYYGAMTAVKVQLAKIEAEHAAFKTAADRAIADAIARADSAHERLDRLMRPRNSDSR